MIRESLPLRKLLPFLAIAATLAWVGTANASLVVDPAGNAALALQFKLATDDLGNPILARFVTQIYVRFTEADDRLVRIGSSQMQVTNGSDFYQHPFGTDTAPSEVLVGIFPSLAFDTFVTIGVKSNDGSDTTVTDPVYADLGNKIVGGWSHSVDAGQGDASSYPLNPDGTYWILIAQLTVNYKPGNFVEGSMLVVWQEAIGQPEQNNSGSFVNHVPSPGALALIGLAGLFGPRRRRR